jgi:large subunit ribosomal protein L4
MATINVYDTTGNKVSRMKLDDGIFKAEVKEHLLHAVVLYQLAKRRAGTHKVKNRSDVSGGGRKPWKQKGTGRARAGTIRAAQFRGGGVVFGPHPRDHSFKLNRKERATALKSALSRRVSEKKLVVLDDLQIDAPKTRTMVDLMAQFKLDDMLLVLPERDENIVRSSQNIQSITVLPCEGVNVYDVLRRKSLVMTKGAVKALVARLGE